MKSVYVTYFGALHATYLSTEKSYLNKQLMDIERILLLFMMDIGEYHTDIQRNCEAISPIRAKHGGRYCLSIPMNEA